jgi:glycosyltransferase involved in cell wall biosynthesis
MLATVIILFVLASQWRSRISEPDGCSNHGGFLMPSRYDSGCRQVIQVNNIPMKVLFLIRCLTYGGAERQLVLLANQLAARGHDVILAVFYGGGPLERDLDGSGVRLVALDKRSRWDLIPVLWRLIRILQRERPSILHGYMTDSNLAAWAAHFLRPRSKLFWGVRASNMESENYDWLTAINTSIESRLSRFADRILVNSRAGLDYSAGRGFPRDKMIHIPNGIDTNRFRPLGGARWRMRAEWGYASSDKVIGLVGRLDPMKDHATFLRAAAILTQKQADARFICVGEGPGDYRRKLVALSRDLGIGDKVQWAAARPDMTAVYNALDVFCSSSRYGEGFPNVIGEAMACGIPCVVTDVGDSAYIVADTGAVVHPNDPEALAEALKKQLDNLSPSTSGRDRILRNFTVAHLVDRTETALWDSLRCEDSIPAESAMCAEDTVSAMRDLHDRD